MTVKSSDWHIGSKIVLLDAWMRNPVDCKITGHPNDTNVIAEDASGIVYYADVKRIVGKPAAPSMDDLLDDLIPQPSVDDLLS